jgi:outer membrane protein assembly factor BamB
MFTLHYFKPVANDLRNLMMRSTMYGWTLIAVGCVATVAWSQDGGTSPGPTKSEPTTDWPQWRGPTHDGIAAPGQKPPLRWSGSENIRWTSLIPGRGHGSPIVVGEQVFVAAAEPDREVQSVLCFDRQSGRQLWQTEVHRGAFEKKGNAKSSHASATCACDGERVFVNFLNGEAIHTSALSLTGELLWQTKICGFVNHQGFGSSPALYGSLVIVSADNKGGGMIAGLERSTGKFVWKHERPAKPNYASPILLRLGGQEQVLFSGCDLVTSLEPLTGKKLWETEGSTTECVTSIVTDGERIFTSGGYPRNHIQAVRADGSGKTAWENGARVYVPSMIVRDGYLYAVLDAGVAMCWKSETGEEMWKGRLGGTFSSSLVLVDGHLLATSESGTTYVFEANPAAFKLVAENQLGSECFATPAICGGQIFHRFAQQTDGKRQEKLVCIGQPTRSPPTGGSEP